MGVADNTDVGIGNAGCVAVGDTIGLVETNLGAVVGFGIVVDVGGITVGFIIGVAGGAVGSAFA